MTSGNVGAGEFFRSLVWPRRGRLGRICGAISILKLYELGFTSGFGSLLGKLLEYYDWLVGRLVWLFEPFIKGGFAYLHQYIGWPETLYSHWKHVFVLLGLYFFREAWVSRVYGVDSVLSNFVLGLFIALTFGALAGSIPLTNANQKEHFLFVAVLILGAAAYGVIGFAWGATFDRDRWAQHRNRSVPTWWGYFGWGFSRILGRSLVGLVLAWAGLQIPVVQQLPSSGVAVSVVLIILFGMYWLCDGIADSKNMRREKESRLDAYLRSTHTQLGLAILGSIFWCLVFVVMRAGNIL